MRTAVFVLAFCSSLGASCSENTPDLPHAPKTVEEAKEIARSIANRGCIVAGTRPFVPEVDDLGYLDIECEKGGRYEFEIGMTHQYDLEWIINSKLKYSDRFLMKQAFIGSGARDQSLNPAYYLQPIQP